jgi:K+-sensing histidine kinase KdpD
MALLTAEAKKSTKAARKRAFFLRQDAGSNGANSNPNIKKFKVMKNKRSIEIEVKLISYKNQPESALILITDTTKIREYEKNKQTDRFKSIYFASVAHDLRTPINAVVCVN